MKKKLLAVLLGVMAFGLAVIVPPSPPASAALDPNCWYCHWGPNPYLNVPVSDPYYRSVALIDNTGNPAISAWIQLWANQMNDIHNTYNSRWPVFLYYQNIIFGGSDPQPACNLGPAQYIVVCMRPPSSFSGGDTARGGTVNYTIATKHILQARVAFSTVYNGACAGDLQVVVTHELGHTMQIGHSTEAGSVMRAINPLGQCAYRGYTGGDINDINFMYGIYSSNPT